MLLPCPECGKQVSDRATSCPGCGFPIAEHLTSAREAEAVARDRSSRTEIGEADCPHCEARGLSSRKLVTDDGEEKVEYGWCHFCEHCGRVPLVRSDRGYWAVAFAQLAPFVAGEIDTHDGIVFVGHEPPGPHRYPAAGRRYKQD